MGTQGTIALERSDGTVAMIYSHWDNYLDGTGIILTQHYTTPLKIQALLDLGNISSLGSELGETHDINEHFSGSDPRRNWTRAYGRDGGDSNTYSRIFDSYAHYCREADWSEYNYLFRNGVWYVQCNYLGSGERYELAEAFEIQAADEAA